MTTLRRCPRANCGGSVTLAADERSDIECVWKCLMCGRSWTQARLLHRRTEYIRQLELWRAETVISD